MLWKCLKSWCFILSENKSTFVYLNILLYLLDGRVFTNESFYFTVCFLFVSGDTSSTNGADSETASHQPQIKSRKRRLPDRMSNGNGGNDYLHFLHHHNNNNNNNNTVKNERLSPGTPETLSRSRSVTPSSASYPGTPPASESLPPVTAGIMPGLAGRNYSDFMRSLAAKYNNANPNE